MWAADRPLRSGAISIPTLVAITTSFRFALRFNQLPMTVSDSPPRCPGTHTEYTSAVSMKLSPALTNASSTVKDAASAAVQPKTLPPRHRGETRKLERPKGRSCIKTSGLNTLVRQLCIDIVSRDTGCELTLTHEGVRGGAG